MDNYIVSSYLLNQFKSYDQANKSYISEQMSNISTITMSMNYATETIDWTTVTVTVSEGQ